MSFRRRAAQLDEEEEQLEVGAYRQLALHAGLTSGDTHVFCAACYELTHLLRIGFAVSPKHTRLAMAEDCVAMCAALASAPACSAASAAAQAVVSAAQAVLPRDKGHAVSVAFRDAAVAQKRLHKRTAAALVVASGPCLHDALFFVLGQCDARTLAAAACVSRSWRACATSPALWRPHSELLTSQLKCFGGPSSSGGGGESNEPVDWYSRFVACAAQQQSSVQAAVCPRVVCSRCWRVGWRHLEWQAPGQQPAGGMQTPSRRVPCGRRSGNAPSLSASASWVESHKWVGASPEHAAHATLRRYDVPRTAWNSAAHESPTGGDRGEGVYVSERRLWSFPHLAAAHAAHAASA